MGMEMEMEVGKGVETGMVETGMDRMGMVVAEGWRRGRKSMEMGMGMGGLIVVVLMEKGTEVETGMKKEMEMETETEMEKGMGMEMGMGREVLMAVVAMQAEKGALMAVTVMEGQRT